MSEKVNQPAHYQSALIEVIDIIDGFHLDFYEGNVLKYLLRHNRKDGIYDLKKAKWYLDRLIKMKEERANTDVSNLDLG
jgi:hypothetical protein